MNNHDKTIAMNGGKEIEIWLEAIAPGTTPTKGSIKVRQIPIREYEPGFKLIEDEISLVGFLVGKDRAFALGLTPESYEAVLTVGREVNKIGFFTFCQRRSEQLQKQNVALLEQMSHLPPDAMEAMVKAGKSILPTASPAFVPPRA